MWRKYREYGCWFVQEAAIAYITDTFDKTRLQIEALEFIRFDSDDSIFQRRCCTTIKTLFNNQTSTQAVIFIVKLRLCLWCANVLQIICKIIWQAVIKRWLKFRLSPYRLYRVFPSLDFEHALLIWWTLKWWLMSRWHVKVYVKIGLFESCQNFVDIDINVPRVSCQADALSVGRLSYVCYRRSSSSVHRE